MLAKCYIRSVVLWEAETWNSRSLEEKRLEALATKDMEEIRWNEKIRNVEVIRRVEYGTMNINKNK